MIVTFSGAIGNGKNRILSHLIEHGYNVITMKGSDGSLQGQLELVNRYAEQMKELKNDDEIHIFESSFIDILIYTTFLYGIFSDTGDDDVDFEEICMNHQNQLVDLNIRLDGYWGRLEENNHGLPTIDIWNVAAKHYFEVMLGVEEHVLSGIPPSILIDALQDGPKALEYLSEETLRVITEYASQQ